MVSERKNEWDDLQLRRRRRPISDDLVGGWVVSGYGNYVSFFYFFIFYQDPVQGISKKKSRRNSVFHMYRIFSLQKGYTIGGGGTLVYDDGV